MVNIAIIATIAATGIVTADKTSGIGISYDTNVQRHLKR
jgi:hypothetical protein